MENKNDEEEINEGKIKNKDILSKEEILNTINMTPYKERIENIIGRQYSYLFFDYFERLYHSKIKNKISAPLTEILNKSNNNGDSLWMNIYKTILFYSKENLPIIITKYFILKAELEYKFIYNESKKYTNHPNKFIDIYIKKMKKINSKKLKEFKSKNVGIDIFGLHSKKTNLIRSFLSKKTIFRTRKLSKNSIFPIHNEEENSDSTINEEKIKKKRQMRTEIMIQIHQLKLKSIKEIEKTNNIQSKQKKKYGKIKSRFLDVFNKQKKILKIINSKSTLKMNNNIYKNFNFNKHKDLNKEEEYFTYSQGKKYPSYNGHLKYIYSKDNIYSKNNSKLFYDDKSVNNNFYYNTQSNSFRKNNNNLRNSLGSNRLNLIDYFNNNYNKKSVFSPDFRNNNNGKNLFNSSNKYSNTINLLRISNNFSKKDCKRPKSGINKKIVNTKFIINKLEQKRNKEFLDKIIFRNNKKDNYNNKIYELFKKTEYF